MGSVEEAAVSCGVVMVWWRSAALAGSELWYCAEAGRVGTCVSRARTEGETRRGRAGAV